MVFFSHKVDICNNEDVIDGPDGPQPALPTPASQWVSQTGPKLSCSIS